MALGIKRGLIGAGMPGPISGIAGGTWNLDGTQATPMQRNIPEPQQAEPRKPGFNDPGGWGEKLQMVGALMRDDPGVAMAIRNDMAQRQRAAQELALRAAERQTKFADWKRQYDYERNNPKAPNNDTVADFNFWKQTLPPDQFDTWLKNRIDPPQYRQGPDGQFYRINPVAPPTITAEEWDAAGGAGPGQRNFPR